MIRAMPIAVLTLPGVISVGAGGFEHVPEDVLDRGLAVGAGDRDHGRIVPPQDRRAPRASSGLHPRLGGCEQQIGADQRKRHELHRDDPDHDGNARQRGDHTNAGCQRQRDPVDAPGARRHRQRFFCGPARVALDRRDDETGRAGQRGEQTTGRRSPAGSTAPRKAPARASDSRRSQARLVDSQARKRRLSYSSC